MSKKTCTRHGEENCVRCAMSEVDTVIPTIYVNIILDGSPSMRIRWTQTISGLNEYLDGLRSDQKENNQPYKVTMTTFSSDVEKIYEEVELDAIPTFTEDNLSPHGWGTALYDAIGSTVEKIDTTEPVLVVILTDGEENSSKKWDESRVNALLDNRKKLGNYTYAYLGVAKEAWGNVARVRSFASSNVNMTADDFAKGGTFLDSALGNMRGGMVGATRNYSKLMRSSRVSGQAMNVSNFYDQPEPDPTNEVVKVSVSSGAAPAASPASWETPDK